PRISGRQRNFLPLGKLSGSHAVMVKLNEMGYHVDKAQMKHIFPAFKAIADEQPIVHEADLHKIMKNVSEVA
ncbi:MAG: homocitrate synthase/isopropylmalate synthase family protein, partial [Paucilactobacillus nenjiangensis]